MIDSDLAKNLRLLCGFEKSVSEVCRSVGINRQQFNKYLNQASRPSPYNLQRISDHFAIKPADLYLPHDEFADRMQFHSGRIGNAARLTRNQPLANAFPGDRAKLRRYVGYYLVYFHSFSWTGSILCAATHVFEADGVIRTKTVERSRDPEDGTLYLSKYDGQVSLLGNRIFVVEHQSLANDAIVETVLQPIERSQLVLLRGTTFGLSSKRRDPYVSRCVWKHLGTNVDLRAVLNAVGLLPIEENRIDPKILRIIGEKPFPNHLLRHDLEPHEVA
ncbi:MAG: helix-turn-helix domain-containing protein [Hyphomicrobiaceae bacterium]